MNGLSERIESTKEMPFCRIPAVNAILEMKKKECDREQIALNVELMLPQDLSIKDLDLCIALGNQLDNAIRECKKAFKSDVEKGPDKPEMSERRKEAEKPKTPERLKEPKNPKSPKNPKNPKSPKSLEGLEKSDRWDSSESPGILLVGKAVQGYLVLRCVNPVYSGEQQGPEGTGYGLKILKDMAERYHGDFFTKRERDSFISQLSLSMFTVKI